ncbi:MAG: transglutaminase domain-containing protein, partial [Bacteroidales bacterium]|nr:transglutaminase domain-containing protein [Bacteroidales bacterium]
MMKRAAFFCILLLLLSSCTGSEKYVDWLYESMPLPDSLMYPRSYWEANVAKTLQVRKDMKWNVPEREFLHFVLPLRVNNETLDDFRTTYADTLCARVKGMSLSQAALEINHWCHEQACYEPSDGRTSAPMATVRRGVGRCGEESVLTVAALRAAGIPARQVYTPRWAHTDDNHAWVEVYTEDGKWHFMGACEPAPTLDNAWFNAPVSRAMLLHTKVYGNYDGPEDVIRRTPCYTEINVIRGYVPARRTVVTVLDGGSPVQGAKVEFKIYNYAEFYTVASYTTGADGTAALDTGLGDLLVWAQKDGKFGFAKASSESVTV